MKLVQNAVYLKKEKKFVVSTHRHDFERFTVDGVSGFIDGGTDYRHCSNIMDMCEADLIEDYTLTYRDKLIDICDRLLWGVLDTKTNTHTFKLIKDLTLDHLKALEVYPNVSLLHRIVVKYHIEQKNMIDRMKELNKELEKECKPQKPKRKLKSSKK